MATISNVKLKVSDVTDPDKRRVTVNYSLTISNREALAGTAFLERVTLWGDDRKEGGALTCSTILS